MIKLFFVFQILSLALFAVAQGERVVCDLDDSKCLTETAADRFKQFVAGVPGVETSDPLYQKEIEAKLPNLYYKFSDAYLSGFSKCEEVLIKISEEDSTYDYHIGCPHLTLEAKYEIDGEIGPHYVKGKGDSKIDFYDYVFKFHGDYVTTSVEKGKTYINLKTHTLDVENNGKAHYVFGNLFDGDKEKSDVVHQWFNDHSQLVEKESGKPAWEVFMGQFLNNVNDFMARETLEDHFSKEV